MLSSSCLSPRIAFPGLVLAALFPLAASLQAAEAADDSADPSSGQKSRSFLFTYSTTVTGLPAGQLARVWLPVPPANEDQEVEMVAKDLPGTAQIGEEQKYGNKVLYLQARAGKDGTIPLSVTYRVNRREVKRKEPKPADQPDQLGLFLKPDSRVPVGGKPLELVKDKKVPEDQMDAARLFYDLVNQHMRYSKEGTGWGRGDAVWACESGYGNCSDFHSLFISLARAHQIPAKFEIGFPLPEKRGSGEIAGYHCWAKFRPKGKDWVPVDISEANKNPKMKNYYFGNLTEDRVAFSTGRDLVLVPKQEGEPLNFFIYPYVEVDGKPHSADKIKKEFRFKDLPAGEEK